MRGARSHRPGGGSRPEPRGAEPSGPGAFNDLHLFLWKLLGGSAGTGSISSPTVDGDRSAAPPHPGRPADPALGASGSWTDGRERSTPREGVAVRCRERQPAGRWVGCGPEPGPGRPGAGRGLMASLLLLGSRAPRQQPRVQSAAGSQPRPVGGDAGAAGAQSDREASGAEAQALQSRASDTEQRGAQGPRRRGRGDVSAG